MGKEFDAAVLAEDVRQGSVAVNGNYLSQIGRLLISDALAMAGKLDVEALARVICAADGRDPDGLDPMFICDEANQPLSCWMGYEDHANAIIAYLNT